MSIIITSLPFDVIVRYLTLTDGLSYSQISTLTFDPVYYVFSHQNELDFSSVLDHHNTISLSDDIILHVLHAHTRATVISNFCLPAHFSKYDSLKNFFALYWQECVNMHNTVVGRTPATSCIPESLWPPF